MILNAPLITPENADSYCGPVNARAVNFDGQIRMLSFRPPAAPYGECRGTVGAERLVELIPRSEWDKIIEQKDREKSWLIDNVATVKCKDQNGLSYCHSFGTVSTMEIALVMAGYPYEELSAESVGGPVTGWRNQGADPSDDLEQVEKAGACLASYMDRPNSLNPRLWKPGWEHDAMGRRVLEAYDLRLPGKEFDAVVTCALLNIPVGLGYAWWGHFIHGGFQVRKNKSGVYEILERNSWGASYGKDGYFWLAEGRARGQGTPDWSFAVRVVIPQEDRVTGPQLYTAT